MSSALLPDVPRQKRKHGSACDCMFCKLIEQGWVLIAPDGSAWSK